MAELIRIGSEQLSVEVSQLGAEMQSVVTADGASWLWHGDAAFWGGRSPVLFPIVGKAPNDQVSIDGQRFGMGQHGFARRSAFVLTQQSADSCRFELTASAHTMAVYPFAFELAVEHRVVGNAVTVTAEVSNRDHQVMPFGIGFHPAFVWPLPGAGGRVHSITLDNGAEPARVQIAGGLIDPEPLASPFAAGRLVLEPGLFANDALIFPEGAGAGLTYGAEGGPSIRFLFENLPNLALWTKPGAKFICVEPWHGMAAEVGAGDELAARPYTEMLGPGATARFAFTAVIGG